MQEKIKKERKVLSVAEMKKADAYTIRNYVDSKILMKRAGEAVYKQVDESRGWKGKIAVICGSGNNAGDGYVLASALKRAKKQAVLILIKEKFSEDGKYYFEQCKEQGVEYLLYSDGMEFDNFDIIVDCIYGTGFKGELGGEAAEIIRKINASSAYVVSVDINSGMDGDTGEAKICVKSDITVSIGFLKQGQIKKEAKKYIKEICLVDIGIVEEPPLL